VSQTKRRKFNRLRGESSVIFREKSPDWYAKPSFINDIHCPRSSP
jgi:hypothetical protein